MRIRKLTFEAILRQVRYHRCVSLMCMNHAYKESVFCTAQVIYNTFYAAAQCTAMTMVIFIVYT